MIINFVTNDHTITYDNIEDVIRTRYKAKDEDTFGDLWDKFEKFLSTVSPCCHSQCSTHVKTIYMNNKQKDNCKAVAFVREGSQYLIKYNCAAWLMNDKGETLENISASMN